MDKKKPRGIVGEVKPSNSSFAAKAKRRQKGVISSQYRDRLHDKVAGEMTEVNIDKIVGYARDVASGYISNKEDMNETLAKIAGEEGLNGDQIQRVVETANLITYNYLYKRSSEDKNIVFKIADPSIVRDIMESSASDIEKAAFSREEEEWVSRDFTYPPDATLEIEKAAEEEPEKRAPTTDEVAQERIQKFANEKRLNEKIYRMGELIKSAMVSGSSLHSEKNYLDSYLTICKVSHDISGEKWPVMQYALEKVANRLYKDGILDEGDLKKLAGSLASPDTLPNLPMNTILNGDASLIKLVKSYSDDSQMEWLPAGIHLVDSRSSEQ